MKLKRALMQFVTLLSCAALRAADTAAARPVIHGYLKVLNQTGFVNKLRDANYSAIVHGRINFFWEVNRHLRVRVDSRQRLFLGDLPKQPGFRSMVGVDDGLISLSHTESSGSGWLWHSIIDRAWVSYRIKSLELTLGRQRINWGINTVWNPNDVFNTYNFFDFDYEERPGCDGFRLVHNMKLGALELAGSAGKDRANRKLAMLWRTRARSYDLQFLTGKFDSLIFAGAGWAGNLKDAGFKGEVNLYRNAPGSAGADYIFLASATVDYTFGKGWFVMGTWLWNSSGGNSIAGLGMPGYRKLSPLNLMPLKQQFAVQAAKQLNPVLQASLSIVYGWKDHLSIFVPSLQYWAAQNWECTLLGQNLFGSVGGVYRSLGQNLFLRVRFSF